MATNQATVNPSVPVTIFKLRVEGLVEGCMLFTT